MRTPEPEKTAQKPWYKTWAVYSLIVAIAVGVLLVFVFPGYDWRLYLLGGLVGGVFFLACNPKLRYQRMVYLILGIVGAFQVVDFYFLAATERGGLLIKSPELGTAVSLGLIVLAGLAMTYDLLIREPALGPLIKFGDRTTTTVNQQNIIEKQENTEVKSVGGDLVQGPKIINNNYAVEYQKAAGDLTALPRIDPKNDLIGREAELKTLAEKLKQKGSNKIALLNGMGGIGKTSLAMAYLQKHRDDYQHVAWVAQLNPDDLPSAFTENRRLISELGLQFTNEQPEEQFEAICQKLRELEGHNLLVIDNADASAQQHEQHLPIHNWKVLVTSRNEIHNFEAIPIGHLSPEKAKELFQLHCKLPLDQDDLGALLKEVEYHTLTVELMAKTLQKRQGSLSVAALLSYLRQHQLDEAALQRKVEVRHWEDFRGKEKVKLYSHLLNTFSLQDLGDYHIWLLQQYAVLPPEPQPSLRMREWLKITEAEAEDFEEGMEELITSGWLRRVEMEEGGEATLLHRMIREVILLEHAPEFADIENLVYSVTALISIDRMKDNPVEKFPWAVYGQSVLEGLAGPTPPENDLRNNLALLYLEMGRYREAASLLEADLASNLARYGESHPRVAVRRSNLAVMYRALGRYEEAAALLEVALESELAHYGESHSEVAVSRSNLAMVYQDLGRYEEAASLMKAALASDLSQYGESHPTVAMSRSNLATVYQDLGRDEEAATLLEAALASDLAHYGELHPSVARSRSNLALVYQDLGRYAEAATLLEAALESDLAHYGESHPNVAVSRSNLALVYKALGRYEEATSLLEAALESELSHYGESHPTVAVSRSNLAVVYQDLGKYAEAATLLEAALESELAHYGESHPTIAVSRSNLARVYKALGRDGEGRELARLAFAGMKNALGPDHPYTRKAKRVLDGFPPE